MRWSKWLEFSIRGKQNRKTNENRPEVLLEEVKEEANEMFRISTVGNLFWFAKMVNEEGYNFQNKTLVLENDLDISEYLWTPVGISLQKTFCGIFDGGGKCISGLRINSCGVFVGFFGVVTGVNKLMTAEICHLHLENISLLGKGLGIYAGGLVGYAQEGVRIDKCLVNGNIKSDYCAGGMVGCAEDCVSIRNCQCSGRIEGQEIVGGIAGRLIINSSIVNCGNFMNDLYGLSEERVVGEIDGTSIVR